MASKSSKGGASASSVDVSQHPGYVNLGNTCFLNSTLQAISATQSLKLLYQPEEGSACLASSASPQQSRGRSSLASSVPSSRRASIISELVNARSKSPVLRLADEEHGRSFGQAISRPGSASIEASSISAIAQQAVANPTPADIQSIQSSKEHFVPRSADLPLNTAFRQVMEKSWESSRRQKEQDALPQKSSSAAQQPKKSSINPKSLLNEMSTKYDQYGEYRQQDGHELLRHLLDSLRMEELDVIRKIQPPKEGKHKRRRTARQSPYEGEGEHSAHEQLKPLVDNLFCGKLLSFVVCESCRHVSHTYEDFYDISLSLRTENESKESSKRQRIRNIADRWRQRSTAGKTESSDSSKPLQESLAMLRDGNMGSLSDTEQSDDPVRRSHSRLGRGIARPKSAADPAKIDANSKEGSKTFIKRQMQQTQADMESLTLDDRRAPSGAQAGGATSLLRAVSGRRTPGSRTSSPFRTKDRYESDDGDKEKDTANPQHQHLSPFSQHNRQRRTPSRHAVYLSKLLAEVPQQPQQSNLGALFWGRRTPILPTAEVTQDRGCRPPSDGNVETQQAGTGLVRALHHFTSVEVLDGPNSFACKRCWRIVNPPTSSEREKLRLRRLRRGKDADESEMSSDDESSSDEEEKEQRQKAALKASKAQNSSSLSSASSFASLSDEVATDVSQRRSVDGSTSAQSVEVKVVKDNIDGEAGQLSSKPFAEDNSTPTLDSSFSQNVNGSLVRPTPVVVVRSATAKSQPALQAPKPVLAAPGSLLLNSALNGSSDEGSAGPLTDPEEDENTEGDEQSGPSRTVRYADEEVSTITKPVGSQTQTRRSRKRSAHSIPRRALKRFLIAETPKVLVFHFKRFQATGRGFSFSTSFRKIDDPITFPLYLDVKPWMAPPREEYDRHGRLKASSDPRALQAYQEDVGKDLDAKGHHKSSHNAHLWGWRPHLHPHHQRSAGGGVVESSTKYRLYAVVVHQGSMSGGHYTAYVLSDRASEPLKAMAQQSQHSRSRKSSPTSKAADSTLANSKSKSDAEGQMESSASNASSTPATSITTSISKSALPDAASANGIPSPAGLSNAIRADPLASVSSLGSDLGEVGLVSLDAHQNANDVPLDGQSPLVAALKPEDRRWIFASDTLVRPATVEEVLKAQAYMLFYEQLC